MFCRHCGNQLSGNFCPNCGAKAENAAIIVRKRPPFYKAWWFWTVVAVLLVLILAGTSGENTEAQKETKKTAASVQTESPLPKEFSSDCPITIKAKIYDNIIGVPELECSITNGTSKEIAAVKLYFVPRDVYGEEVNTIFTAHELYTDTPIDAGATTSRAWQMLDDEIKAGDVYIYSVYFSDGTEWGDRDASISTIKKYGIKITITN